MKICGWQKTEYAISQRFTYFQNAQQQTCTTTTRENIPCWYIWVTIYQNLTHWHITIQDNFNTFFVDTKCSHEQKKTTKNIQITITNSEKSSPLYPQLAEKRTFSEIHTYKRDRGERKQEQKKKDCCHAMVTSTSQDTMEKRAEDLITSVHLFCLPVATVRPLVIIIITIFITPGPRLNHFLMVAWAVKTLFLLIVITPDFPWSFVLVFLLFLAALFLLLLAILTSASLLFLVLLWTVRKKTLFLVECLVHSHCSQNKGVTSEIKNSGS